MCDYHIVLDFRLIYAAFFQVITIGPPPTVGLVVQATAAQVPA